MQNAAGLPSMYQQMAWPGWPGMAPSRSQWFDSSLHAGHSLSTGPYQPQPSLWSPYDYAAYYNSLYQVRQKQNVVIFWRNFHDWLHWNCQKETIFNVNDGQFDQNDNISVMGSVSSFGIGVRHLVGIAGTDILVPSRLCEVTEFWGSRSLIGW